MAVNTPERMPGAIELPIPYSPAAPLLVDVMLNLLTIAEIGTSFEVIPEELADGVEHRTGRRGRTGRGRGGALFLPSNGKLAVTNWPTLPAI